jgi:hypothetical protein
MQLSKPRRQVLGDVEDATGDNRIVMSVLKPLPDGVDVDVKCFKDHLILKVYELLSCCFKEGGRDVGVGVLCQSRLAGIFLECFYGAENGSCHTPRSRSDFEDL